MVLRFALFVIFAASMLAANLRLYLKDGDYQMVREYQVLENRVRFYSSDRAGWEEIPLELVDLKRTEKESADKAAAMAEVIRQEQAEDQAIKADKKLTASVPDPPGPYWIDGESLIPLVSAEVTLENSKSRRILQAIAPAPIIAGKTTVTIANKTAKFRLTTPMPEFFFRLAMEERFGIIKLSTKKNERLIEDAQILPNGEGVIEDMKIVPTFKKQLGPQLYKLWTEQALEPGEYALVEYTDGEINPRIWDFGIDKK